MTSRKKRFPRSTSSEDEEESREDEETEQPGVAAVEKEAQDDEAEEGPPDMADPFIAWFAQETSGNPVDFENLPEFNDEFAKLVEKTTRCPVEFTALLRREAYIYSYEKFVTRLGGEATYIFDVFGITIVKKYQVSFLNSWILAQYLRKHPLVHPGDPTVNVGPFFDITMFDLQHWEEYWTINRRTKREEFMVQFGLRHAHDTNRQKQFDSDISDVTHPTPSSKSTKTSKKEKQSKSRKKNAPSAASFDTRSPIKERRLHHEDDDDDEEPPSSSSDNNSRVSKRFVTAKKHQDSKDFEANSVDSEGDCKPKKKKSSKKSSKVEKGSESKEKSTAPKSKVSKNRKIIT